MAHKQPGPRRRPVPQRTCIACRQVAGKRELVRLVRTAEGIEIDSAGKKPGRGAYLHPYRNCWQAALRSGRLEQALRAGISQEDKNKLLEYMASLPADAEAAGEA